MKINNSLLEESHISFKVVENKKLTLIAYSHTNRCSNFKC